ncbi:hypothetical protein MAE02_63630 [Microvirga aerophila]|uniref:Nitric oxide synthase (NOS) domain-containing protein n=1 Tax=Microvirga aerophila TaxID=670291 RepID=A0A512C3P2_9HYPH|nr:hypothetical protein MAE02_63630 [Microvirga aerophila]
MGDNPFLDDCQGKRCVGRIYWADHSSGDEQGLSSVTGSPCDRSMAIQLPALTIASMLAGSTTPPRGMAPEHV